MKLDLVGRSLADIDGINAYIRSSNPIAAARVFAAIKASATRLRRFPRSGPPGRQPGTREIVVPGTPYLILPPRQRHHHHPPRPPRPAKLARHGPLTAPT